MNKKQLEVLERLEESQREDVRRAWAEKLPHTMPEGLDTETAELYRQADPGLVQSMARKLRWGSPFGVRPLV